MNKFDVIVIGGSAAGLVSAMTGKANYPDKKFLLIRKEKDALVPCGIPYIFGTLESSDQNVMPLGGLSKAGIEFKQDEVIEVDRKNKTVKTASGEKFQYEKLIFATGSTPHVPNWLKGSNLENVFVVPKNKLYLDELKSKLNNMKKIVVIGAGFIGVEVSDELNKCGKDVTLVEILPSILGKAFDIDIAREAENTLIERGLNLKTNVAVKELIGTDKVQEVILENGEKLEADAVILAMGYTPNTCLAKKSGLELNKLGALEVDSYLRTDDKDIFAAGDCAAKVDFITRKDTPIMLASTAASEARIVGMNLYKLSVMRSFTGTVAIFSTAIGDISFASAGITEEESKRNGFEVTVGKFQGVDKHPATLPGTKKQIVKIIAAKDSKIIMGGEVIGGESAGELINVIGLAIQKNMTVTELYTSQIGTHPLLTSAPTQYPLIKAVENIILKI
ncbi:FAD-dependent oxidoreductase [uncultured Ilyobacter sp.]|uniref:FAD-dependent oxidoreductase n=1 Tax=uncultured Ilyobacter sp. TaxID=544433 RepID=UPI0029C756D5|nr:FAD-dependent oxidoreductase [uncultured Ilyobacter sp.]